MRLLPLIPHLLLVCLALLPSQAAEIVFPDDPQAVLDVKKEGGAIGDGVADDTDALQRAIETCTIGQSRFIYLPKGIYRITRSLVFRPKGSDGKEGSMVGPWLYGQERDTTIIRLANGAVGFSDPAHPQAAIRSLSRADGAQMNADFFDRTLVNLTIDSGKNAGAVGIAFYSNNTGLMQDVSVIGSGTIGIDLGSHDQNGPLLIQDVAISGFAIGLRSAFTLNSQTLSRVAIRAREVGIHHRGQVLTAEALDIRDTPLPIDSGENGVLSLVDCTLRAPAGASAGPAIAITKSTAYFQRLAHPGFAAAIIGSTEPMKVDGQKVAEFTSSPAIALGGGKATGLGLTIEREPEVPFPRSAGQWVCANDFGAANGDEDDDGPAIQKAVDAAAAKGAKAVYLRGARGGDPNWYWLKSDVRIHGSVERIMGFGFARILAGDNKDPKFPENLGKWVLDDDANGAPTVIIQHLKVFSNWPSMGYEARSTKRTLVLRSVEGAIIARPGSKVFASNMAGLGYLEKGARVWARQWNTEGHVQGGAHTNTVNRGGALWILGMKTEHHGTKLATLAGGRSEVLGVHNYNTTGVQDDTPFFLVDQGGALSCAGYREICFNGGWWKVPVLAKIDGKEYRQPLAEWCTWSLLRSGK